MTKNVCPSCHGDGFVMFKDLGGIIHAKRCVCNPKVAPVIEKKPARKDKKKVYREQESWFTK